MRSAVLVRSMFAALMCGALTCDFLAVSSFAAEPDAASLIKAATSGDAPARIKAIKQLAAQPKFAAAAVEPLSKLLGDSSPQLRAYAAHALGKAGAAAKPAVPALAELLKDPEAQVRQQAIQALVAIHPGF